MKKVLWVWIGGFYRDSYNLHNNNLQLNLPASNSIGLITEIFATPDLRIGYSYDYSLGKLKEQFFCYLVVRTPLIYRLWKPKWT